MSGEPHHAEPLVAFLLALRARGFRALPIMKALESVPRGEFTPHQYADLAYKETALPIPCGQTMPDPFYVARLMEALALEPHHRVLEIGSGSGYVSAVLGRLAGSVTALERFSSLVTGAQTRLAALNLPNVETRWADGLSADLPQGRFDRILIHASIERLEPLWRDALTGEGLILAGQGGELTAFRRVEGGDFRAAAVRPCRLRPLIPGLAQGL